MKSKIKLSVIFLAIITSSLFFTGKLSAQQGYVSFQVFYDQLSPYGQWVDYPNYGNVWIPDAGSDFSPYSTRGYWIMTDYGWTWQSDYSWGWAPFHYGRWSFDNYYGWFWVPDYEWGPAWVNWRGSDGYYGWSPMQPGVSLSVSFGMGYNSDYDHWNFVRGRDFGRSNINRYYVSHDDHDRIVRNSTVINNTYIDNSRHTTYVTGPSREDVQRVTGKRVRPVTIQESTKPEQRVRNGNLHIYRPQVTRDNNTDQKAPPGVATRRETQQSPERTDVNQRRAETPVNNTRSEVQPNTSVPQKTNSNFSNTYRNDNSVKTINRVKSDKGTENFNNRRNRNSNNTRSMQQQDVKQSPKAQSDKQSPTTKQSDNNDNTRQRRSRSEKEK